MKTLLTLLAAAGLFAGAALAAENWTKPQQEVADVFIAWAAAIRAGDIDQELNLTAPAFTAWDYAKPAPLDRAAYRQAGVEFQKKWKTVECDLPVVSIVIEGNLAVAHGRYREALQAAGTRKTVQGPWTSTLVRQDGKWLVLGLSFVEDRPKIDEAAIRDEVKQVFLAFKAACESANPAAQLAFYADVPEFCYVDIDGKRYDYAGHKQLVTELFAGLSAVKIDLGRYEITVLGADKALVLWTGALDLVQKEGPALRSEPYSGAFLWKRLGGAWKLVLQAESALAPQPVPAAGSPAAPAASPEMQKLAVWYGEWTYAGEYHATPLGEAAKFTGTMSGRPTLNGYVAEFINREKGPAGETQALELCWVDPAAKKFAYVYLGNDGYIEQGPFTMTADLCTWEGTGVAGGTAFKIKGTEKVSLDQRLLIRKTEICLDGKTWLPFFDSKFTKVVAK